MRLSQKGAAAAEAAIVLPPALFLIFAVAEICLMANARQMVHVGVFRAARSYLVLADTSAAEKAFCRTVEALPGSEAPERLSELKLEKRGQGVSVVALYRYKPVFPVLPLGRLFGKVEAGSPYVAITVAVELSR
jgi:hypothetical protein